MNQYTIKAMTQLTSGVKLLSGEQASPISLKLSENDQKKLAQSKATKATSGDLSSQNSQRVPEGGSLKEREVQVRSVLPNEPLTKRLMHMFPGIFEGSPNDTIILENLGKLGNEHNLVVYNDRMTLDKLETQIKPPELALMEQEENYDIFSVSPSLIDFSNELDINEANELAITRRIYMN